jgi:hypothetical protein
MRALLIHGTVPTHGRLRYTAADFSLSFEPLPAGGASAQIGTLQLEVDPGTGDVLYPWGYLPRVAWREARVIAPGAAAGGVRLAGPWEPGVSRSIVSIEEVDIRFDASSGWLYVGASMPAASALEGIDAALVADGCIAIVRENRLWGVYLRPEFG